MKFKAQAGGLLAGIKPLVAVATKGILKDHPQVNLITLTACMGYVKVVADGGHVRVCSEIGNDNYNLDYVCEEDGVVTVNASDLESSIDSFSSASVVSVRIENNAGGRSLIIADGDEVQTLPLQDVTCDFDESILDKKNKSVAISLRRDMFISYANKVAFAQGEMEQFKQFTYWILKASGSSNLRFAAGSGTRFAIVDLEGTNLSNAKKDTTILFPNQQTQPILSVLGDLRCQDILIEAQDRFVLITCGKTRMCLYTCDPSITWPDENTLLNRSSKFLFTTKVSNWKNAIKGISATNNADVKKQNKVHGCNLSVDLSKKIIQAKTEATLKSSRKIVIDDIATNEENMEFAVNCVSAYLNEIISKSSDDTYLQFEVDELNKPIVVRFYSSQTVGDPKNFTKATEDGIKEKYSVLIATMKS